MGTDRIDYCQHFSRDFHLKVFFGPKSPSVAFSRKCCSTLEVLFLKSQLTEFSPHTLQALCLVKSSSSSLRPSLKQNLEWQHQPGFFFSFRLGEETSRFPAESKSRQCSAFLKCCPARPKLTLTSLRQAGSAEEQHFPNMNRGDVKLKAWWATFALSDYRGRGESWKPTEPEPCPARRPYRECHELLCRVWTFLPWGMWTAARCKGCNCCFISHLVFRQALNEMRDISFWVRLI